LNDAPVEFERSGFVISTDRSRIEPDTALSLLHSTFWARGMDRGRGPADGCRNACWLIPSCSTCAESRF
jgi:hypothetical protein